MVLKLAYSPCPNDTFIFYALAHRKIDMRGLRFEVELMDVETLNAHAAEASFEVSKMSFHAYARLQKDWNLCDAGAALGRGNGPLLVGRPGLAVNLEDSRTRILLPGKHTTAALLMHYAFPAIERYDYCVFNEVERKVLNGEADAGVLIHETRFLYASRGLELLADLGLVWEQRTGLPIPLGGIAMRKDLPEEVQQRFEQIMRESVLYAMQHPKEALDYVKVHAQEMDPEVMRRHIAMFVNEYTVSMGEEGRKAVKKLCEVAKKM